MSENNDTTKVLVEIAVIGNKIDNLVHSVGNIDRKVDQNDADLRVLVDKKADAKEMDRRFDSQDRLNLWALGFAAITASGLIFQLIKPLLQ